MENLETKNKNEEENGKAETEETTEKIDDENNETKEKVEEEETEMKQVKLLSQFIHVSTTADFPLFVCLLN